MMMSSGIFSENKSILFSKGFLGVYILPLFDVMPQVAWHQRKENKMPKARAEEERMDCEMPPQEGGEERRKRLDGFLKRYKNLRGARRLGLAKRRG